MGVLQHCPKGGRADTKINQNFCGIFASLCYIRALSNGLKRRICPVAWAQFVDLLTDYRFVTTNKKPAKKTAAVNPAAKTKARMSATAAAILGTPIETTRKASNGKPKIRPEWSEYYENLLELRERLLAQMNGLAKESAEEMSSYSLHMADSGTDNFDRDFALSLLSADQDAIYEIEEALKRIEKNTYGVCELTGKTIPKARLSAIPWTRFTVEAQAQLERDGALRQRRLGQLGTVDSAGAVEVEEEDEVEEKPAKEKE
jgi:DnaK suppressor protein